MSGPEFVLMAMTLAAGTFLWTVTAPRVLAYLERRNQHSPGPRPRTWQIDKASGLPYSADAQVEIERIRAGEREKARQTFERLASEKLDLLKTGINMGYREQELRELDLRLEQIIGSEDLRRLINEVANEPAPAALATPVEPAGPAALHSADLSGIPTPQLEQLLERARQLQAGS